MNNNNYDTIRNLAGEKSAKLFKKKTRHKQCDKKQNCLRFLRCIRPGKKNEQKVILPSRIYPIPKF